MSLREAQHDNELRSFIENISPHAAVRKRLRSTSALALYDLPSLPDQNSASSVAQGVAHEETHGESQEQSMTRDELLELRKATFARVERMRKTGDYAAGASDIRENAEALLKLQDHLLERMKIIGIGSKP